MWDKIWIAPALWATPKNPAVLSAINQVQGHLGRDSLVGKTVSFVDFIKRMNQAMNADHAKYSGAKVGEAVIAALGV